MAQTIIFLVDMQTFYASCEKADHPEWRDRPVIVAGDPKQRSGIVLAADPLAKKYGVKTAEFVSQAVLKCPQAVLVRPRMQHYIDVAMKITDIFYSFTDLVEPFSIDEQFLDVTGSQKLFGQAPEMAKKIQGKVMRETGVYARVGIGKTKVLSKLACDNFAKKNNTGIFELTRENMKQNLWPLPVGAMIGVGHRMEQHLVGMGIRTIGTLATYPVELLRKRWGVNGIVLWQTANGIDPSPVDPHTHDDQKAIGNGMTLPVDYADKQAIKGILLEMSEEVARRARKKHYLGSLVSCGMRGASFAFPTGFYRQMKIPFSTNFGMDIYHAACILMEHNWDQQPVRSVSVALADLEPDNEYQLDIFGRLTEKERLNNAMDVIYRKYGKTALFRGSSLYETAQLGSRSKKIGGHWK